MKVTHVEDHVTHAVISGAQAIDFGISDSPEFFNILSSTLYTDQILAVVRETLCNAWDAHIEFKCEHVPVEITLDDNYLVIRDFGPGIAPAMMGPIYGTYGGSTKKDNKGVTGGFGLGCKSPFAYVDDFEVTSFHDGKMGIYRLSKSNAEVGGKPSIVPVVSNIPTEEHGLQVKIAIKNPADRNRFNDLIHRIVQNGAMLMTLDGKELPTLPFDDMQHGFMITKKKLLENFSAVAIRYGNVIYPIQKDEAYGVEWDKILQFLNRLNNTHGYNNEAWTLVLQAAPNTVSVTPSRESLSNQKHTLATITTLMNQFLSIKHRGLEVECFKLLEERIENVWLESTPAQLFSPEQKIPNLYTDNRSSRGKLRAHLTGTYRYDDDENLTSFPQFVRQYAKTGYPDFKGFRRKDMLLRVGSLIESGFNGKVGRKQLKAFRRELLASEHRPKHQRRDREGQRIAKLSQSSWFHKEIIWPLIKGMDKESNFMRPDKLFVYAEPCESRWSHDRETLVHFQKYTPGDLEDMFHFARNIVILSFNRMDVIDGQADDAGILKYWLGQSKGSLVYVVPRAEAKVKAARDYFLSKGVNLIDLTVDQQVEYVRRQKNMADTPAPARPKKTGIVTLKGMCDKEGYYHSNMVEITPIGTELPRTKAPKFVLKDGRRNGYDHIDNLTMEQTKMLVDLYGEDGAVCTNQNQMDRYMGLGAVEMQDYVLDQIATEFETNANIRAHMPYMFHRIDLTSWNSPYGKLQSWGPIIMSDRDLFEYLGIVDDRTEREKKVCMLERIFRSNYWRGSGAQTAIARIDKVYQTIQEGKGLKAFWEKLRHAKLLAAFDSGECSSMMLYPESSFITQTQRLALRDAILNAIEG